ncbi:MAG: 4Fe-4S binding protein, partial [Candidatus Helarchaeales archaeon]
MNVDESQIYRDLQQHLDTLPIGFPATKSGVELRILKLLFTPEEARIATRLQYAPEPPETLEEIHERLKDLGYSIEELEQKLDEMVKKGTLLAKKENEKKYYGNALFAVGMYEFQVNKLSKEFIKEFYQYVMQGYGLELFRTKIPQLRTIPIEEAISAPDEVAQYDQLEKLIKETEGPIAVTNCICRQARDIMGHPCKVTDRREMCMGFGTTARLYIDQGWAREIDKKEALEILRQNQRDGLVLQPSNAHQLEFICSCCACCCGLLLGKKIFPRPVELFATNYFAEIDQDACVGCGTCAERCQMEALIEKDGFYSVNLDRCIGCGVCVPACPSEAIRLIKKDTEREPPKSMEELYSLIEKRRKELIEEERRKKELREK